MKDIMIKYVFLPVILGVQAFFLMVMMQTITFADDSIIANWFSFDNLFYLFYNFLLFFVLLAVFFGVTKRGIWGYVILGILTGVVSFINNMKYTSLKECVTISDFSKLSEAVKVGGEAEFQVFWGSFVCIAVWILSVFVFLYMEVKWIAPMKEKKKLFRVMVLASVVLLLPMLVYDMKSSKMAKLTEARTSDIVGPAVYFIESIAVSQLETEYTIDEAEASYKKYVEKGKQIFETAYGLTENDKDAALQQPNVIVIMSEAFFDVNRFSDVLSYDKNPMEYFEEVQKESLSGNVMVNIYGGSTHFSEFEFLTGWNSKGMESGSCPYKEYFNENQPSLAEYMDEQGYYTLAIHPYDGYFWNRKNAYPNMGFDKFIDRSWMKYTDMCGYISDDALTNEIISEYEKNQKDTRPFFCFGVSIANHIAIINGEKKVNPSEAVNITFKKNIGYSEAKKARLRHYISGIYESGKAIKKLTDYLEKQDEPVILVFFGDHAPNYALDLLGTSGKEGLAYSTPYLIWSNYDLEKDEERQDMTVSYLSTYLLTKMGFPLTEQCYYNIALHDQYPVATRYSIVNKEGKLFKEFSKEQKQEYFNIALDLKKQVDTLLDNPEEIEGIWSVEE